MPKSNALPRSNPESQGVSSKALFAFVEDVEATISELHSFMFLRHGQVVAEGWWAPYAPQHPHTLFSLTKSFTSTAVGLAVAEGRLSIDDPVLDSFPEDAPKRPSQNLKAMRVRHLLSMSTGHLSDSTEKAVTNRQGNWIRGFFSMPVKHAPGAPFVYNSAASHMLSAIVQKVSGLPIKEYLTPRLFDPLGIAGMTWETDPRGINTGGWGLSLKTEDIARFGQMYLQNGIWEGRRILPEEWVEMATSKQVSNDIDPQGPLDWRQGYGFQFWRCQHNAYRGDGAFGQYCIVMPEQDAVLAITSGVKDMQAVLNLVWKHILPGMSRTPLPADTPAQRKLHAHLADLCLDPPRGEFVSSILDQDEHRTYHLDDNPLQLKTLDLEVSSNRIRMAFENGKVKHALECGRKSWVMGRSSFFPNDWLHGISAKPVGHPVAAACAWTAEDTLEMQARFYQTPFKFTITCQFEEELVKIDTQANVSFGPTQLPSMVGHLYRRSS